MQSWRDLVDADPELIVQKGLGRRALDDHIPQAIDNFQLRLRAEHELAAAEVEAEQRDTATKHAEQRWTIGYDQREVLREWGHFQRALLVEIGRFAAAQPQFDRATLYAVCVELGHFVMESASESGARYVQFLKARAAERAQTLQASLDELQAMENDRADFLRQAAHDLRGSAAVVANVTALLERREFEGGERQRFYGLLQRRIQAMGALLTQLMTWAQLETGQEAMRIESFDVSERIRAFCDLMRPIAEERGLTLKSEGPDHLMVESDLLTLQRILQNLLLNAIHATKKGGITVIWQVASDPAQWVLSVQDTGPGFDPGSRERHVLSGAAPNHVPGRAESGSDEAGSEASHLPPSAGLGISIVERLCEALGGKLEFRSSGGPGTTAQVTLPKSTPKSTR